MGKSMTSSVTGMKTFQAVQMVRSNQIWIGIGKSTPWNEADEVPDVMGGTTLQEPIGFKKAEKVQYVQPDENGTILQLGQKWKTITEEEAIQTLTRWVYVAAWLNMDELPTVSYRQAAVITNLQFKPETPIGSLAVKADEVANPGYALVVNNRSPIQRTADQREFIEFIIEF